MLGFVTAELLNWVTLHFGKKNVNLCFAFLFICMDCHVLHRETIGAPGEMPGTRVESGDSALLGVLPLTQTKLPKDLLGH